MGWGRTLSRVSSRMFSVTTLVPFVRCPSVLLVSFRRVLRTLGRGGWGEADAHLQGKVRPLSWSLPSLLKFRSDPSSIIYGPHTTKEQCRKIGGSFQFHLNKYLSFFHKKTLNELINISSTKIIKPCTFSSLYSPVRYLYFNSCGQPTL